MKYYLAPDSVLCHSQLNIFWISTVGKKYEDVTLKNSVFYPIFRSFFYFLSINEVLFNQ